MFRTLILACALLFVPGQQQRPLTDIAFDLERIAAELRARPETLVVPTGGDVNATLAAAKGGDTVVLQAGVRYVTGGAPLQAKNGVVTVTSSATLPDRRIGPADAPLLPILASGNGSPVFDGTNAANWKFDGVQFEGTSLTNGETIKLQDASNITFDRVLIVPATQQKRAIRGNGRNITLTRSYIANIWSYQADSQTFCAWDGAGPYTIVDNYLEAAGENVMFGGADSASVDRIPSDITIDSNVFNKNIAWKATKNYYSVKNLLEFKVGKRVKVRNNIFMNNWTDAQNGYAILLKSVNQGGTAPWSALEDVEVVGNVISAVENGFNILGISADQPGGKTTGINIHDNTVTVQWVAVQLGGKAGVVAITGNQFTQGANLVTLYGTYAAESFAFTGNKYKNVPYGIKGDGTGSGLASLTKYCLTFVYDSNVIW
jgi:hypothetical protein